jgi:hypothetical protein
VKEAAVRYAPRVLVLVLLLPALVATTAGADEEDFGPCTDEEGELVFEPHRSWITQEGTKAGNLAATEAQEFPTWHDEEPTASVQEGAGSGYLGTRFSDFLVTEQDPITTLTLEGVHSGCLDVIAVELYLIDPGDGVFASRHTIRPNLTINDVPVYAHLDSAGIEAQVDDNPHGDLTVRARFAFTDIHSVLVREGVDPEGEHEIHINVTPQFANSGNVIYVYDAAEVPSNLHFNGPIEGYKEIASNW